MVSTEQIDIKVKSYPQEIPIRFPLPETTEEIPLTFDPARDEIPLKVKGYPEEMSFTMPLLQHPHIISIKLPDTFEYLITNTNDIFDTFDGETLIVKH